MTVCYTPWMSIHRDNLICLDKIVFQGCLATSDKKLECSKKIGFVTDVTTSFVLSIASMGSFTAFSGRVFGILPYSKWETKIGLFQLVLVLFLGPSKRFISPAKASLLDYTNSLLDMHHKLFWSFTWPHKGVSLGFRVWWSMSWQCSS